MADTENMQEILIEKNSKIVVNVDESLPDILVVTYEYGSRIFQGVLLDSTKRNLPFGVHSLHPAYTKDSPDNKATEQPDDRLYSANQRFTYQEGAQAAPKDFTQKRAVRLPARYKNAKLTVRLRPRQVLCSKCRGICNENSENVDATKKRKASEDEAPLKQHKKGSGIGTRASRPLSSDSQSNELQKQQTTTRMCLRLMPIVKELKKEDTASSSPEPETSSDSQSQETTCDERLSMQNNIENNKQEFQDFKEPSPRKEGNASNERNHEKTDCLMVTGKAGKRMVLRKKKSVGSMEDLWDESCFEENAANLGAQGVDLTTSTRTIKISFGREGEGTVLKIPAKIEDLGTPVTTEESTTEKIRSKDASAKAARRALKKAKKEARRKILLGSGGSPCYALGNGSPRYTLAGNGSPRYSITSPRHGLAGGHSPRYAVAATPNYENMVPRRHKHKLKHKKKHREDRKAQRDPLAITANDLTAAAEISATTDENNYTEIKERCLKQKLSINLKRLNASAYTRFDDNNENQIENNGICVPTIETDSLTTTSTITNKPLSDSHEEHSDEHSEHSENVPDFPSTAPPLLMHITAQTTITEATDDTPPPSGVNVNVDISPEASVPEVVDKTISSALGADGRPLNVGDVVWGKIHGFPWWPGKVLSITEDFRGALAHVAWYGSSTSSLMPCAQLSPFLENFKIRYNKKKRGPYKEAIKQATNEARIDAPSSPLSHQELVLPEVVHTPTAAEVVPPPSLVQPALASPREIDVVS